MRIFLHDSFVSIVAHRTEPGALLVRARHTGDIEAVFPKAYVVEGASTDCQYRAVILRAEVAQALAARVDGISYLNFKDSVADRHRHDAYFEVWEVMQRWMQPRPRHR